jgi:hypothetical protein
MFNRKFFLHTVPLVVRYLFKNKNLQEKKDIVPRPIWWERNKITTEEKKKNDRKQIKKEKTDIYKQKLKFNCGLINKQLKNRNEQIFKDQ